MVRVNSANARNRRSSLLNVFKYGKENLGPPTHALTASVSSIAPSTSSTSTAATAAASMAAATDRVSIASDTNLNGGAALTHGDDSSNGGLSDLEIGALPGDAFAAPLSTTDTKRKKKQHRRIGSFGMRPNDDGEHRCACLSQASLSGMRMATTCHFIHVDCLQTRTPSLRS